MTKAMSPRLRVDQGFRIFLRPGSTHVIHGAKIVEDTATVDLWAMLAFSHVARYGELTRLQNQMNVYELTTRSYQL